MQDSERLKAVGVKKPGHLQRESREVRWQAKKELKEERWKGAQGHDGKAPVLTEALSLIDSVKTHCLFSHRAWGECADLICVSNIIWLLKHQMHEGRAETQTAAMSGKR